MLPPALVQAAELALQAVAPAAVEEVVAIIGKLGHPVEPEVVQLVSKLVAQIAASPNPVDTAKRAVLATASSEATDAALAHLMR